MRLVHAETLELREFADDNIPPYAILSHTWGKTEDEISFQDLQSPEHAARKPGYFKISNSCRLAVKNDDLAYVWVDTCCIDKTSSAELSESINSMFRWYQSAKVCYAYLEDVPDKVASEAWHSAFGESRWFTRGWTLQELIAPTSVRFYSGNWTLIGTKAEMCQDISKITGIDVPFLQGQALRHASIAKRMSWASKRRTTRVEDTAYSLLGIFNVNMPMLYGEGDRAFTRLQRKIIKDSDDQSIFAWGSRQPLNGILKLRGLLAESPAEFSDSGNIIPYRFSWCITPYSITNQGLRIELRMAGPVMYPQGRFQLGRFGLQGPYFAVLSCRYENVPLPELGILLVRMPSGQDNFARLHSCKPLAMSECRFALFQEFTKTVIFVKEFSVLDLNIRKCFSIRMDSTIKQEYVLGGVYPSRCWNAEHQFISLPDGGLWEQFETLSTLPYCRRVVLLFKRRGVLQEDFLLILTYVGACARCCIFPTPKRFYNLQQIWESDLARIPSPKTSDEWKKVTVSLKNEVVMETDIYVVDIASRLEDKGTLRPSKL